MEAAAIAGPIGQQVFGLIGQQQKAKAREAQLEQQAKLAETRAIQKDLARRQELDRVQSAIKATRTSRGGSLISPLTQEFLKEANEIIGSERLRAFAAERQQASNLRAAQAATKRNRRMSLFTGIGKIGTSLVQAGAGLGGGGSTQTLRSAPHLGVGGTF